MNPQQANHNPADEFPSKQIRLPRPDAENITVLTRELPNNPILPWHRFDSPWIQPESEGDETDTASQDTDDSAEADVGAELEVEADPDAETDSQSANIAQLSIFDSPDVPSDETSSQGEQIDQPGMEFLNYDSSRDG